MSLDAKLPGSQPPDDVSTVNDLDPPVQLPPPDDEEKAIINEAQKRFQRCVDWESQARKLFLDDLKFANADSDNGYQWPNDIKRNRDVDERPSLTINKVRQHNLQIINDARQNKPGVTVRPTGNGATYEAAQIWESLIRHIEQHSNATVAYMTATSFQVQAGIGYIRVATDYADDESFDQEIFIRRVPDPLNVYMDPDAKELDKSDMRFCFVYEDMPLEVFEKSFPEYRGYGGQAALGAESDWISKDHIRVCEYFRAVSERKRLYALEVEGKMRMVHEDKIPPEMLKDIVDDPLYKFRETEVRKIERIVVVGERVAERNEWAGRFIPIIPVIGEETVIDGTMDRKGHTRAMKDAQRMYNYWSSAAVEFGALQGKTPWLAPAEAIEGYETYWNTANRVNHSVLPYNGVNDQGQPINPPERTQPPTYAPAYMQGMEIALQEINIVSGQYEPQMGQQGNERSAKAINERQRQGDNATYHYIDHLGVAIRHLGNILLDLIPHIYDTKRITQIIAEDGKSFELEIDPQAEKVFEEHRDHDQKVIRRILNPKLGVFEVDADVGPGYATKREEAFNAFTLILTQAPQLASIIGDILFKAGDFPMAEEAAERLKRMVPPQALGEGPTQSEAMLQQQVQQLTGLLQKTMDELAKEKLRLVGKDAQKEIDVYDAETKRVAALSKLLPEDPTGLKALIEQLVQDALATQLGTVQGAVSPTLNAAAEAGTQGPAAQPPAIHTPGARLGLGGHEYVRNWAANPNYFPIS